ncbi:MAG TPA: cation diffusion facilitator family transporter [bacterium]|nr:cation diffusion facilitator family transporter [bacterium]HPR88353.1 cation diffusion facilitator family transporter [bacterium]
MDSISQKSGDREKRRVALTSVLAAVALTGFKLAIGIVTGSLGILAEAAHSALDLIAAVITLFAVRISSQPADREHTYGHGKVENLSALAETILLLLTCIWIVYESIHRIFFKEVQVEVNIWAFAVVIFAVLIDYGRSRALYRTAKKYNSQALEADALHFSTDIWSSLVVLAGLVLVLVSRHSGLPWLAKADAIAALIVAAIVIYVSLELGRRTVGGLLDAVPAGLLDQIGQVIRVPGVLQVGRVRARHSGPDAFADITVMVARDIGLEQAHDIAAAVEERVHTIIPGSDVVVHLDPIETDNESVFQVIRLAAARLNISVHGIRIYAVHGKDYLEQHIEVSEELTLEEAHAKATSFEEALHAILPGVEQIVTHIEPVGDSWSRRQTQQASTEEIRGILFALPEVVSSGMKVHDLLVHSVDREIHLSFHYSLAADLPIKEAHLLTERIEQSLRHQIPNLGRVIIHTEPD